MEPRTGARLEIRLLGPVEVHIDGAPVPLGGRRQQALLALLAIQAGRTVSAEWLIDEIWSGEPPDGAGVTLRSYVSRLRSTFRDAVEISGGDRRYALEASPDTIDAARFERLVRDGEAALGQRDPRRAAGSLREALALWRGAPFADVALDGALEVEARRLEELRLHATEVRIEADLGTGRAGELVDELEVLVREHPFRERLWHHLMVALYRAGRQADALAAYRRAREGLDEQLGIEPSEELQALEAAILRHEVPAASALSARRVLPSPVSSFVGRGTELEAVAARLHTDRLVTLTGIGGVGKTRLALEIATRAAEDFRDGVAFVDLSPLADPSLVVTQVAAALGLREHAESTLADVIGADLRESEMLLVLDNCEHVREAAAVLAERLLTGSPALRVLATSREPLGVPGEVDVAIQPLSLRSSAAAPVPEAHASPGPSAGAGPGGQAEAGPIGQPDLPDAGLSEAAALFLARARAARPALATDPEAPAMAARICADLEGLPLAIELAAARAKSLSLADIAERLDDRFRFLVSWRRLTTARHRTLLEAMDWSYELLGPLEQAVLARLAAFSGGFDLAAVAAICAGNDEDAALAAIERLVDASLVIAEEHGEAMRYRLLETVRGYAARRLTESGEAAGLREAHASWYAALADQAAAELTGDRQAWWFERLEAEHNNLRAALATLADAGRGGELLRMTISLTRFWYVRGYLGEGRSRLEAALAADRERDPVLRRRALTAAASLALLQGEYAVATGFAEASLEAARGTGELRFVANALSNLGAIVLAGGDVDRAGTLLVEAVATARQAGDERIMALAINNLGDLALTRGEYAEARPLFEESLALLRARGDMANIARALFNRAAVALKLGDLEAARDGFRESLAIARDAGDREDLAWAMEGAAALAAARGEAGRAALLLGSAGALLEAMGAQYKPFERSLRADTEAATRSLLGDAALAEQQARGAALALDAAIDLALETSPADGA